MATIYKYGIPYTAEPFETRIKGFQEVVHAGLDASGSPCFWAIVNPDMPEETWEFLLVATGQPFDTTKWVHLNTFNMNGFIWHLMRPLQQWGVTPGASMEDEKATAPSASITRHMIGDLRKHLRSARIITDALSAPLGGDNVKKIESQLDDIESDIHQLMKSNGIPQDSVTMGYEDESH